MGLAWREWDRAHSEVKTCLVFGKLEYETFSAGYFARKESTVSVFTSV